MEVTHVFGGHIYLISNFGVARNPIFKEGEDVIFFQENMNKYLGKICDIYAYSHQENSFHYLVKIKERPTLEEFYHNKKLEQSTNRKKNVSHNIYNPLDEIPPESYLIFSQEVSNCLNSYAKKFNFKYNRKGGLFADRYSKTLIECEREMERWVEKLNGMQVRVDFKEEWKIKERYDFVNKNGECSSDVYYGREGLGRVHGILSNFVGNEKGDLRGSFMCLPPKSRKSRNFSQLFNNFIKIMGFSPPW